MDTTPNTEPSDPLDLTNLGFDLAPHREVLNAFDKISLASHSVKPALRARDIVFVRVPEGKFRIGTARAGITRAEIEAVWGCLPIEIIHEAATDDEARAVRAEVERYFRRHFPGRVLSETVETPETPKANEGQAPDPTAYVVFVACYASDAPLPPVSEG